jgi:chorismate mutase
MPVRGIRGATTVLHDQQGEIRAATIELLNAMEQANPGLNPADIASILFTTTPDIVSAFPAKAAREIGWTDVPLMDAQEIPITGSLPMCIRVLVHWNTRLPQSAIQHVYLHDAVRLRPDLVR